MVASPLPTVRRTRAALAGALSVLGLAACAEDPSYSIGWRIYDELEGEEAEDPPSLESAIQCSQVGIHRVRVQTFDALTNILVDSREFQCFSRSISRRGIVDGPELSPGDYTVRLFGMQRNSNIWGCTLPGPDDRECPPAHGIDRRTDTCYPCIARAEAEVTIEEDKVAKVGKLSLRAPGQCDDGVDNDRDGRVDRLDAACQVPGAISETSDSDQTTFSLRANFLHPDNNNATCERLGVTHYRLSVEDEFDEFAPCVPGTDRIPSFSQNLEKGDYTLTVTGVTDIPSDGEPGCETELTVPKEIDFVAGDLLTDRIEFLDVDFLEPIVGPVVFTMEFASGAEGSRTCSPTPNAPNLLTIDEVELFVRDVDGQLVDASELDIPGGSETPDGSVRLDCPNAAIESADLDWGSYSVQAQGIADGEVCFSNLEAPEEPLYLVPSVGLPLRLARTTDEDGQPPQACWECSEDADCGACQGNECCCLDHVCLRGDECSSSSP